MTAGIIIYFFIIAAILIFDGAWVFTRAKANNMPILECNFLRYIRPIELLLSMFAITMLELVVQYFDLITAGFVNYTTIILGVFAIVYIADFIVKEVRFKGYNFVVVKTGKIAFKELTANLTVKSHLDDTYMKRDDIIATNAQDSRATTNAKAMRNYLVTRVVMAVFMIVAAIASAIAIGMVK